MMSPPEEIGEAEPYNADEKATWFDVDSFSNFGLELPDPVKIAKSPKITPEEFVRVPMRYVCYLDHQGNIHFLRPTRKDRRIGELTISMNAENEINVGIDVNRIKINNTPDAIYSGNDDKFYFRDLRRTYAMFPGFGEAINERRDDVVADFLATGVVRFVGDFDINVIGHRNLLRMRAATDKIHSLSPEEMSRISPYITSLFSDELSYDNRKKTIVVESNRGLGLVLAALEERVYRTSITMHRVIAASVTPI